MSKITDKYSAYPKRVIGGPTGVKFGAPNYLELASSSSYVSRIKKMFGSSLIRYFPLWEPSGNIAYNISPLEGNGQYINCTLKHNYGPGFLDGFYPYFNGTSSYCNIYSAALNAAFDGQEGAIGFWCKVSAVTDWNVNNYSPFGFQVNTSNRVFLRTFNGGGSDYGFAIYYNAGGDSDYLLASKLNNFSDWIEVWISWSYSNGELYVYCNGLVCEWVKWNSYNFPMALTGAWVGDLDVNYAKIGYYSANWKGWISHVRLLNRPVAASEVRTLNPYPVILFDGDSRTGSKPYPFEAFGQSQKTWYGFKHLGTSGGSWAIITAAAPTDVDPVRHAQGDICVVWTGVNDSGLTALQIHDLAKTYCLARKAAGWKVLVCTEIDAQDAGRLANGWPTKYLDLNNLLRADYTDFADGLADLGENPNLQDATNLTYFNADKVHLTNAGYTEVANVVGPALYYMN